MPPPPFRDIPSVDRVLRTLGDVGLPPPLVVAVVRRALAEVRKRLATDPAAAEDALTRIRASLDDLRRARLGPVINGTGIVIHTNFGRSPLAAEAVDAMRDVAASYNTLEYDRNAGARGNRGAYVEQSLALLCNAESATVVNNCAAALVLILQGLTTPDRPEVILSRGELVQIGGGFRIPDILAASGAVLREVGTTNQTTVADYRTAITGRTAMLLKVHRSNFYMAGFVDEPTTSELVDLAREHALPFVEDLGGGAVFDVHEVVELRAAQSPAAPPRENAPSSSAPEREPTPAELFQQGVDLVCFSGDKLLGGPQAGVIVGRAGLVAGLKRHPFFRALRCDKLILSALQATVDMHLAGRGRELPIFRMMALSTDALQARAETMVAAVAGAAVVARVSPAQSQVGGGTMPRTVIASVTLDVQPRTGSVDALAARLRVGSPAVVGYIAGGWLRLDLRTVFPQQDAAVIAAIHAAIAR